MEDWRWEQKYLLWACFSFSNVVYKKKLLFLLRIENFSVSILLPTTLRRYKCMPKMTLKVGNESNYNYYGSFLFVRAFSITESKWMQFKRFFWPSGWHIAQIALLMKLPVIKKRGRKYKKINESVKICKLWQIFSLLLRPYTSNFWIIELY